MAVDEVVEEGIDSFGYYRWRKRSGITTEIRQDQGLDIVLIQEHSGIKNILWNKSEPGYILFSILLNYQQTIGQLPPLEEIQHLFGQKREYVDGAYPYNEASAKQEIEREMHYCVDGRVDTKGTMPINVGPGYPCFIEDGNFVIAVRAENGKIRIGHDKKDRLLDGSKLKWRRSIILDPKDASRVMKFIYHESLNKKYLERLYHHAASLDK